MDETPQTDGPHDVVLLLSACAARLNDDVLARVRHDVGADISYRDGYVFQHLVAGARSVTALAGVLGVSQQAASKQVADLERRGLVVRRPDPDDARAKRVSLSERGTRAVEAGRTARRAIVDDLIAGLGEDMLRSLTDGLAALSEEIGAMEHLLSRRLRPETAR